MSRTHDTTAAPHPTAGDGDTTHVLDVDDLSTATVEAVLDRAAATKAGAGPGDGTAGAPLAGDTVAMLFEKPSTRTRLSFEAGVAALGGSTAFTGPDEIHLGRGEPVRDTARAFAAYADAVVVRLFDHADAETFAAHSSVPVVNGLTDRAHPCQALADLLTVREVCGFDGRVAWVGDGNNVAASLALGAAAVGLDLTVATPPGHELPEDVLDRAAALGDPPAVTDDPQAAVDGADAVYTDVWVSMGEDEDRESKVAAFADGGFQVNGDLLPEDAAFMHCLPANRGEEVTDDVIEGERSVVWQQAENRQWVQMALLEHLIG